MVFKFNRSTPFVVKVIASYLVWAILCGFYQARVITRFGFTWNQALTDALITQLVIALGCFIVNKSHRVASLKKLQISFLV